MATQTALSIHLNADPNTDDRAISESYRRLDCTQNMQMSDLRGAIYQQNLIIKKKDPDTFCDFKMQSQVTWSHLSCVESYSLPK